MTYWCKACNIFFFVAWLVMGNSQNPFDIKAPSSKKEEPKETVSKTPPTSIQDSKPISVESQPSNSSITPNQTSTVPSSISNPFEIKPNKGGEINKTPLLKTVEPANVPTPPTVIKNPIPEIPSSTATDPNPKPSIGLNEVNNPFNIKQPQADQNANNEINIVPSSQEPSQTNNSLNNIKNASSRSQGNISKNLWFIIYIFLFLLAAVAINFNRSYPLALIKSTYNQNQLRILFKDAFKGNQLLIFGFLYFIFIFNAGIFLYLSFRIFGLASISLLMSVLIVFGVYLTRHFILWVLSFVFPLAKEASYYSYTIGIYNLALGLALMIVNILLSFVDPETGKMLIFSGLTIILALYLMRQARGLLNNMPLILSSKFHFIIYLCTVEIAPWILLSGILLE